MIFFSNLQNSYSILKSFLIFKIPSNGMLSLTVTELETSYCLENHCQLCFISILCADGAHDLLQFNHSKTFHEENRKYTFLCMIKQIFTASQWDSKMRSLCSKKSDSSNRQTQKQAVLIYCDQQQMFAQEAGSREVGKT